jgi:homoserine/homoserine lactone efflux protein
MTGLLASLGGWFEWLRWIGVAYLAYLGLRQWRAPAIDLTTTPAEPRSARAIFLRGLLVSLTNPKTLLFYGAFFPQFLAAGRARKLLAGRGRLGNRLSGGLLLGAGLGLALARKS